MPTPSPSSKPRARLSFSRGLTGSGFSVGPESTRSWMALRLARFSSSSMVASSRSAIEVPTIRERPAEVSVTVTFIRTVSGLTDVEIIAWTSSGVMARPVSCTISAAMFSLRTTPT